MTKSDERKNQPEKKKKSYKKKLSIFRFIFFQTKEKNIDDVPDK